MLFPGFVSPCRLLHVAEEHRRTSTFNLFALQVAWELVSELRHCLVDKMQQEDQATQISQISHISQVISSYLKVGFWLVFKGLKHNMTSDDSEQAMATGQKKQEDKLLHTGCFWNLIFHRWKIRAHDLKHPTTPFCYILLVFHLLETSWKHNRRSRNLNVGRAAHKASWSNFVSKDWASQHFHVHLLCCRWVRPPGTCGCFSLCNSSSSWCSKGRPFPRHAPLQAHKLCVGLKMLKSLDRLCGKPSSRVASQRYRGAPHS